MSKQTRSLTTSNKGKHLHKDQTTTESTRTLRSHKTTKSEDALNRETMTNRKHRNASGTAEPSSKVILKSNAIKQRHVRASQSGVKYNTAHKRIVIRVEQTGKKYRLKSESKRQPEVKRKYLIRPKSASPTVRNTAVKTKRSQRKPPKSTNKGNVERTSSSAKKNIKIKKTSNSTEHCKSGQSVTKDITALQNIELNKMKDMSLPNVPQKQCIRVVGKLNTDLKGLVSTICCVDEHTMWIGRQAFDRLMKVEYHTTGELTILKQFPEIHFADFCFDRAYNQILLCDLTNKCIISISSNFEVKEIKSLQPLCPCCITFAPDNFIFVGLVHAYAYDCGETDPRHIIKMDRNGKVYQRINSLQDGSSNFMFTFRCIVNPVNNDLVVVGYKRSNEGCVANFNAEGLIGFLYYGKRFKIPFIPRGLTCSSKGNILVINEYNGDIHILNKTGRCLYLMDMKATGLYEKPWSFSWDLSGHLLIGTMTSTTGNILITEYTDNADDD